MTHAVRLKAYLLRLINCFSCFLCIFLLLTMPIYANALWAMGKLRYHATILQLFCFTKLKIPYESSKLVKLFNLMNTMQVSYQELRIRYMSDRNRIRKFRTDQIRILLKCYSCFNTLCSGSTRTDLAGKFRHRQNVLESDRIRIRNSEVITDFI